MSTGVCVEAPVKVNFGLKVLPRRADGFHPIESIFQTFSLCDTLEVKLCEKGKFAVDVGGLKVTGENTVQKAYRAFCEVVGCDFGADVKIAKRIPAGGGLGGGSSDAAAFIKAFAKLCGVELTHEQKFEIASQVGSDVFFFLLADTGCALVSGRGEIVNSIEPRSDLHLLLVFPGVHSGTKGAYELLDSSDDAGMLEYPAFAELETVYRNDLKKWSFVNSFTPAIAIRYPEVGRAIGDLKKSGALYAEMSGSGSTVFGVFASKRDAENANELIAKHWSGCVLAQPVQ